MPKPGIKERTIKVAEHEYNPEEALEVIMRKIRENDAGLADHIQTAIDDGKEILAEETPAGKVRQKRKYRKKAPYTYAEAIDVAINSLEAYFVQQPLFILSMSENFKHSAVGVESAQSNETAIVPEETDKEKTVLIEMITETKINRTGEDTAQLKTDDNNAISEQKSNVSFLRDLTRFNE